MASADLKTNDYADNETRDNSEIDRTKSARCSQFASMLRARISEYPGGEKYEEKRSENNSHGRSKTCDEPVENDSRCT